MNRSTLFLTQNWQLTNPDKVINYGRMNETLNHLDLQLCSKNKQFMTESIEKTMKQLEQTNALNSNKDPKFTKVKSISQEKIQKNKIKSKILKLLVEKYGDTRFWFLASEGILKT